MKCPKCFNEIPDDSKICPICQNIFASYFEEKELTTKQKIKLILHKTLFPSILIILLISLVTIGYIMHKTKMDRITDVNKLVQDITLKSYINDLYISDERHYKYLLNKKEQELYDEIINAIKEYKEYIEVDTSKYNKKKSEYNTKTLKKIKQAISMDHPELINLGYIKQSENIDTYKIHFLYTISQEEYDTSKELLKEIIENLKNETKELNKYDKIEYIYNYINEHAKQNKSIEPKLYSATCILNNECNSEGFAKISQIIFQNLKINSILATGNINTKYHEWNIVEIEKEYYYYDQTREKILFKDKNYELYNKQLLPKINGKKYAK